MQKSRGTILVLKNCFKSYLLAIVWVFNLNINVGFEIVFSLSTILPIILPRFQY